MEEDRTMIDLYDHVLEQISEDEEWFFKNAIFYYWIGDYESMDYFVSHLDAGHEKLVEQFTTAHADYMRRMITGG